MKAPRVKPVRCAIYTRVSTEHELDQDSTHTMPPRYRTTTRNKSDHAELAKYPLRRFRLRR
jgi:hypothetical protein